MKKTNYKKYLMRQMGLTEAQFIPSAFLNKDEEEAEEPLVPPLLSPTARPNPILGLAIRGSSTGGLPSGADQTGTDISPTKVGGYDRVEPQNLNHHTFNKTPSNPEIKQETTPVNPDPSTGQGVTHPHQIQVTAHEEPQSVTGASTDSDSTLQLKSAIPKGIDIDIAETGNTQKAEEKETNEEDNDNAMIPSTSLSETFERNKQLMREKLGLTKECATCGCGDPTKVHDEEDEGLDEDKKPRVCYHCKKPHPCDCDKKDEKDSKLKRDNPQAYRQQISMKRDKKVDLDEDKKPRVCFHCKQPRPCKCDKKDQEDMKLQDNDPEEYRKRFGMKISKREDLDEIVECKECHNKFNYRLVSEVAMGAVQCPACDAVLDQSGIVLSEGKHKAGCQCGFCKNKGSFGKKKKEVEEGDDEDNQKDNPDFKEKDDKDKKVEEQQRIDESYAAPFQRMRSLAGVGNMILTSNGLFENKNDPGANKPFNTNWKMDKEKAGFVKIDEEKLNKVKATLQRKSKRGTLSDKELQLAKKLDEVLKKRGVNESKKDLEKKLADMKSRKDKEQASADSKKNMDRLEKEKRRDDLA